MSQAVGGGAQPGCSASRHANGSNPASDDRDVDADDSDFRPDVPTVEERVAGLLDAYPDRMLTPVAQRHGTKLREEALAEPEQERYEVEIGDGETMAVAETVERSALPWVAVVEEFLRDYESYRDKWLRFGKGRPDEPEYESFTVPMNNSYHPKYQQKQYARLKALKRQLLGEEADASPTGEAFAGAFEEPVTVLLGLTSSSTTDTDDHRPVVEHDREIRDAWGGSDGVRRTLRYVLSDKLGLDASEYAWWWQSEPHPGGGAAAGYSHSHPVVILDAAAVEGDADLADAETYRPVVAKHVAETPGAEWDAHRLDDAVTVREGDDIEDFAGYVAEYVAVDTEQDLLERSDEYIMWAASQWASTSKKYSKSRTATAAIQADACHQRYADPEAHQSHDHGDRVVRSDRPGVEFECAECGSAFEVPQDHETLTAARLASDGGVEVAGSQSDVQSDAERTLAERWPSAREAASVGAPVRERECGHPDGANECPLCAEETGAVPAGVPIPDHAEAPDAEVSRESFERPPEWRPEAVVRRATGEETQIGTPGGVDYGEVVVEGAGSLGDRVGVTLMPEWLEGPEPWTRSPDVVTEAAVRAGDLPPPEVVQREYAERSDPSRAVTEKRWRDDWYARRFERDGGDDDLGREVSRCRVRRYVAAHPSASVVMVMGALGLPPSARSLVEDVVVGPADDPSEELGEAPTDHE